MLRERLLQGVDDPAKPVAGLLVARMSVVQRLPLLREKPPRCRDVLGRPVRRIPEELVQPDVVEIVGHEGAS